MKWCLVACLLLTPVSLRADGYDELHAALTQRLLLMEDVARFKWNVAAPISDPTRERALLDALTKSSADERLPAQYLSGALDAQMAAARAYQLQRFAAWLANDQRRFAGVPDLQTEQRPAIDRATARLLEAIRSERCIATDATREQLLLDGPPTISPDVWALAVNGLFPMPRRDCARLDASESPYSGRRLRQPRVLAYLRAQELETER